MQTRRRAAAQGVLIAAAVLASACSLTIGAEKIHGRASLFAPLNREVDQSVEDVQAERFIVAGLIAADSGRLGLARSYLQAKGYSPQEVETRLSIIQAQIAASSAEK